MRNDKEAVEPATKACKLTNGKQWGRIDTLAAAFAEAGDFANAVRYEKPAIEMSGATASNCKEKQRCRSLCEPQKPNHEAQKQEAKVSELVDAVTFYALRNWRWCNGGGKFARPIRKPERKQRPCPAGPAARPGNGAYPSVGAPAHSTPAASALRM